MPVEQAAEREVEQGAVGATGVVTAEAVRLEGGGEGLGNHDVVVGEEPAVDDDASGPRVGGEVVVHGEPGGGQAFGGRQDGVGKRQGGGDLVGQQGKQPLTVGDVPVERRLPGVERGGDLGQGRPSTPDSPATRQAAATIMSRLGHAVRATPITSHRPAPRVVLVRPGASAH
ncbi:hypothetical protein [Kutzneria sp. 744]|uniref:hypothetical protein n=1 Tax=Kutzneria sp. (strain 744) TaxID=345341 RepID=UPI001E63B2DE|nr:hypothetical protein [Kutzneria sp. 744]